MTAITIKVVYPEGDVIEREFPTLRALAWWLDCGNDDGEVLAIGLKEIEE